jgi:hypothetical protein
MAHDLVTEVQTVGRDGGHRTICNSVDVTPLFSLHENAIAKKPGLSYPEYWRCVC